MFFSGMAGAFSKRLEEERATNAATGERQAQRENAILQHLSTSDDPDIATMALAGLTDQTAGVKRKGLRGFLGEMEGHPALPTLRALIQAGRQVPNEPHEEQVGNLPAQPLNPMGGLPGGEPPPSGPAWGDPTQGTHPEMRPTPGTHREERQIFLSPDERAGRQAEATVTGKLTAFRAGMRQAQTPEEQDLVRDVARSPRRVIQSKPVVLQFADGSESSGSYDPETDQYKDAHGQIRTDVIGHRTSNVVPRAAPAPHGVKVQDKDSPTGWSEVFRHPDGSVAYTVPGATPYTPPPAFSGQAAIDTPDGPQVVQMPRGGGAPVPVGPRAPAAGAVSVEQQRAQGVVAAIDKAIADVHMPGVPVKEGLRDSLVKRWNDKYGYHNWTYADWVAQAQGQNVVKGKAGGPPPLKPGARPAATGKPGAVDPSDPMGIRKP